jgi:hypothetical protein
MCRWRRSPTRPRYRCVNRKRRAAQHGKKGDPGEVSAGRQPGDLHLDEIKLVVDRVEVGARGVGLPQRAITLDVTEPNQDRLTPAA